jgi:hypothetical protein
MRTFDPWIGSRYMTDGVQGVRLLILGESHYGLPGDMRSTFTVDVVRWLGQQHRFRFFTIIQRLVTGTNGWLSNDDRSEFWERVAFYNYIQSFPGTRPRWRPTPEMWLAARDPFLQTVNELSPQVLLVLGKELSFNLPNLPAAISVCKVQHPSSRGFRYANWRPQVKTALEAAQPKA